MPFIEGARFDYGELCFEIGPWKFEKYKSYGYKAVSGTDQIFLTQAHPHGLYEPPLWVLRLVKHRCRPRVHRFETQEELDAKAPVLIDEWLETVDAQTDAKDRKQRRLKRQNGFIANKLAGLMQGHIGESR